VLKILRSLLSADGAGSASGSSSSIQHDDPPVVLAIEGAPPFALLDNLTFEHRLPVPNWLAVTEWVESISSGAGRAEAWAKVELAWLAHMRAALGNSYRLMQADKAVLLSSLDQRVAHAAVEFMGKTLRRVCAVLEGLAQSSEWGHDILIVFDDDETYYRYVARYYPEAGEFAASGGMHISQGCSHFVTMKSDLYAVEPVVVHEMTHGCLSHLSLPAWLNEGLAVNTEQRLCPPQRASMTPQEMHAKHLHFWGAEEIQEFWSGKSFLRTDDGNMLSYDLARILVSQFAGNWEAFKAFACAAHFDDGGQAAAVEHLGISLGAAACAILEREASVAWDPNPSSWPGAPERGAFTLMPNISARTCFSRSSTIV
jgi:hypothetical protein